MYYNILLKKLVETLFFFLSLLNLVCMATFWVQLRNCTKQDRCDIIAYNT